MAKSTFALPSVPPLCLLVSLWCLRGVQSEICPGIQLEKIQALMELLLPQSKCQHPFASGKMGLWGPQSQAPQINVYFCKKKKKALMKRHLWMQGHIINESHVPQGSLCYTLSAFRLPVSKTTASYLCLANLVEIIWRYTKMQLMETPHRVVVTTALMAITTLSTLTGLEWKPFKQLVIAPKLKEGAD